MAEKTPGKTRKQQGDRVAQRPGGTAHRERPGSRVLEGVSLELRVPGTESGVREADSARLQQPPLGQREEELEQGKLGMGIQPLFPACLCIRGRGYRPSR